MNSDILAIGMLLTVLVLLALVAWQHRTTGKLVVALTETVQATASNSKIVDLIEPLATKVVPVDLVGKYDKGADFLKTFTPDDIDKLIDALSQLVHRSTDGLPNTPDPNSVG